MRLSHVAIEPESVTCADGETRTYDAVSLIGYTTDAEGREWRCAHLLHGPDHWGPAVDRAAHAAADRYGVEILDLRD